MSKSRGPFHGLVDTFAEMSRMRERALHSGESANQARTHATAWIPTLDIFAAGEDLVIRCELAGVSKDEVEITLSRGVLWIWGERGPSPEAEARGEVSYYVRERDFGPFRRSINMPESVGAGDLRAVFLDGLLDITVIGGAAPAEVEHIEIGAGDDEPVRLDVGGER